VFSLSVLQVQAVVKKYDILFIADEVICAFGRLGTMFGCDKYNIKPDLVTLAKVRFCKMISSFFLLANFP